jgi:hypothetical protein
MTEKDTTKVNGYIVAMTTIYIIAMIATVLVLASAVMASGV